MGLSRSRLRDYAIAVAAVAVSTAVCFAIYPHLDLTNLVMVYLLGTLGVAYRGHRGPAGLASVLSVVCFDYFFVPPRFSLNVTDTEYLLTFVVMFTAAMIISNLTVRLHSEASSAREGQRRTTLMHAFTQQLTNARNAGQVLRAATQQVAETFHSDVIAFLPDKTGKLENQVRSSESVLLTEKDQGMAQWVYDSGQPAGLGTDTLPVSDTLFLPLRGEEAPAGVLMLRPRDRESLLQPEQKLLLGSFAHQFGLALEVHRLQDSARKAEVEVETERLRSALLSSVSHDLRTPLAGILGSASALLEKDEYRKNPGGRDLLETIEREAQRLSRLIQNLLETTRLESGTVQLRKERYPLDDIIGAALGRVEKSLQGRDVSVAIPESLPTVPLDGLLMEQVFINLLENAVRHTPPGTAIRISALQEQDRVRVSIADRGPGLKENELERVFDKFYHDPSSPGAGLGLAICRAVLQAHGGKIWAENQKGGGAVFHLTLPLESHES